MTVSAVRGSTAIGSPLGAVGTVTAGAGRDAALGSRCSAMLTSVVALASSCTV